MTGVRAPGRLLAVSDLHAAAGANKALIQGLRREPPGDRLVMAGGVAETADDVQRTLAMLADRFDTVVHSWLPEGATSKAEGMAVARETGLVLSDEVLLHPDPYPSREAWCAVRVAEAEHRLAAVDDPDVPLVLVNHHPLVREPTRGLRHPHLTMWCGTWRAEARHRRFRVACVLYGHLHIPRRAVHDGVPLHDAFLGHPREWHRHGHPPGVLRRIGLGEGAG